MWADRRANRILLAAALAVGWPRSAHAEGPPPLPPAEAPEERVDQVAVEPPVSRPPWTGREAIWGGVGLIVAGAATLIIVAPALCAGMGSGGTEPGAATTGPSPGTKCVEATVGGGAGAVGLGVILLAVGETQRAVYKTWLRKHPMFGGLSVTPTARGPALSWTVSF